MNASEKTGDKVKYKYRRGFSNEIEKVEITRETEKSIWLKVLSGERKAKKLSRYEVYYDTFEEAKECLIKSIKNNIEQAEIKIESELEELKEAEALKENEQ